MFSKKISLALFVLLINSSYVLAVEKNSYELSRHDMKSYTIPEELSCLFDNPPMVHPYKNIMFFVPCKSGSTTLLYWFLFHVLNTPKTDIDAAGHIYQYRRWLFGHLFEDAYPNLNEYLKALVVRNPYARTVSSFLHCCKVKTVPFIDAMKKKFSTTSIDKILSKVTFEDYIEFLENQNITQCDFHYRAQTTFLLFSQIDIIIHLENLGKELAYVCQPFDISTSFNPLFTSEGRNSLGEKIDLPNELYFSEVPYSEIQDLVFQYSGKNAWPNFRHFFTPEIINRVQKIYSYDFENLDYSLNPFLD